MKKWIAHLAVAFALATMLIGGHQAFTTRTAADCAPLICQSLNEWWDWALWMYYGCQRPPCEIGG